MTSPAVPSRPTPGQTGGQTQFKEFRCTWKGCLKSFSRAEHLHRHALNHNEDNGAACERCSAVFKRKDLLGTFFFDVLIAVGLISVGGFAVW